MSDEQESIYAIEEPFAEGGSPLLKSAPILKETPKRVEIRGGGYAFGYKTFHRPEEVARTPKEAWERFALRQIERIEIAKRQLVRGERLKSEAMIAIAALDAEAAANNGYDEADAADDVLHQERDEHRA